MGCLDPGTVHIRRWERGHVMSREGCARTGRSQRTAQGEEGRGLFEAVPTDQVQRAPAAGEGSPTGPNSQ